MTKYQENMCRICLQEYNDDFEGIFGNDAAKKISPLGILYVELFQLSVDSNDNSPQFLCNYCNLQLKLFHKFKTKAIDSFTKFSEHNLNKTDGFPLGEMSADEGNNNDEDINADEMDTADEEDADINDEEEIFKCEVMTSSEDEEPEDVEICQENVELSPIKPENSQAEIDGLLEFEEVMYLEDDQGETLAESILGMKHTAAKPTKAGKFPCKSCDEVFDFKSHLTKHRKDVHKTVKYTCTHCPKKFISKELLQVHTNLHLGLPGFQCELCDKSFKQKAHYIYHIQGHRNERNVQCHLCSKRFLNKSDFRIHLRVHNDERRYECDVCGNKFRAHTHMKNHRYTHFGKTFECEFCDQKYTTPATLKTHIRSVHNCEYPYMCDICKKPFKRRHHLKAHQKTHAPKYKAPKTLDN